MPSPKTQFVIIDGHALLHRAWHALPPLTTKNGLVVHGAYGFTMIMLGAIKKFGPEYLAVTFDLPGGTFRHEAFEEYKAQREKKPDELYAQVDVLREILEAMQIPVFAVEGFEADDVIGTLSRLANEQDPDVESIIVTGDLDTLQLVDKRTKVFTLRKGMSDTVLYDEAAVHERYGFKPLQLIDYKALRGDPSDNIPGVKGIGEKTGTELIGEFGSVPNLYAELDKDSKKAQAIKAGVREKLLADRANAMLALDLCRIRRDAPVKFKLRDCAFIMPTRVQMTPVFTQLEFMKLLNQFPGNEGVDVAPPAPKKRAEKPAGQSNTLFDAHAEPSVVAEPFTPVEDATQVTDAKALKSVLAALGKAKRFAFRTADGTLGLHDGKETFLVSGDALVAGRAELASLFASKVQKICFDLKNERKALLAMGLLADVGDGEHFFDLMIASYALHAGERRHALDAILAYERAVPIDAPATIPAQLPHFLPVADIYESELKTNKLTELMDTMELPLAGVLARMELTGISIDKPYFAKLAKDLAGEIADLTADIHKMAGGDFNINSPAQMKEVLFDKLGISSEGMKKTAKNKTLSTAASELEKLKDAHPIVEKILRYRELTKLLSTYVEAIPTYVAADGRVHAEFNQTVAATGRLSGANPNMQNIPAPETDYGKRVRSGFVASKGYSLLAADYSQIELRIAAHIANEKAMIKAFTDGEDIHQRTAVLMFGEAEAASKRRIAKVINFGIIYGMGPNALAGNADITFGEARDYIAQYFALHQGIARYMEETRQKVLRDGFVETMFGRKRFFRNVKLMNPRERAEAERQAINMPVQGANADIIKLAMIKLDAFICEKYGCGPDSPVRMLVQVHDELVFEVRKDLVEQFTEELVPYMTDVVKMKVPVAVNVSVGQRWGDMKKVK